MKSIIYSTEPPSNDVLVEPSLNQLLGQPHFFKIFSEASEITFFVTSGNE